MRQIAVAICCLFVLWLGGCAQDEKRRAEMEAGGTIPWNRPASWEGQGAMGAAQFTGTP